MLVKPRKIHIRTGKQYIAILDEELAHKMDLHVGDRIKLTNKKKSITAILEITEKDLPGDQIQLYSETYDYLNIKKGDKIKVSIAQKPLSTIHIRKKLDGKTLNNEEIDQIIKDVVNEDLSNIEMTYFVSGCYMHGLNDRETTALTTSIVQNGSHLSFRDEIIVDKHCIGGVPGNRTTMIVIPILTACGLKMPKTSSRAITSPAGTADTMEVLCNVTIDANKLQKIAKDINGFISWGGGVDLAAADDRMIQVRHPLRLDPEGMLLASIMAKKKAVSANHVLIDIPVGKNAKVKSQAKAKHLKNRFLKIAKLLGMKAHVLISNGSQPIGNGVGPLLEVHDVIKVLKNEKDAPVDLKNKSIHIAGILLELTKKAKKGWGEKVALEILESGAAYKQMQKIIKAQGRKKIPAMSSFSANIKSEKDGIITEINNKSISRIARIAGAPKDTKAGLFIYKKLKCKVKKGDILYTIYAGSKDRLDFAKKCTKECNAYTIK